MELGKEVAGAHTQSWGCFQVVSWQGCRNTKNKAFFATGRKSEWGLRVGLEPLYNNKKAEVQKVRVEVPWMRHTVRPK